MKPFDVYKTYLSYKNHFTKESYDFFKYKGKTRANESTFKKRKDRYFFERMSRKKSDQEILDYFTASFSQAEDPRTVWIGQIIDNGDKRYKEWSDKMKTLPSMFGTEASIFLANKDFDSLFSSKNGKHPEVLKTHLKNAISIETMVLLDMILGYAKNFDSMLIDPVWETVSFKIRKYKPFLNIDIQGYKKILRESVV
jgi:hypothetical protein|tara:strand:+ start:2086 stop:2676 length:591 start_codon:yes stop_codon:yes gene_type:complete